MTALIILSLAALLVFVVWKRQQKMPSAPQVDFTRADAIAERAAQEHEITNAWVHEYQEADAEGLGVPLEIYQEFKNNDVIVSDLSQSTVSKLQNEIRMWRELMREEKQNPSPEKCSYDPESFYNDWCDCHICLCIRYEENIKFAMKSLYIKRGIKTRL